MLMTDSSSSKLWGDGPAWLIPFIGRVAAICAMFIDLGDLKAALATALANGDTERARRLLDSGFQRFKTEMHS